MIDFTPILQALIGLLASIITVWVIPWIKARTTNEQQAGIRATVRTLVFAAEQLFGAGNGEAKLEFVMGQLRQKGINVDRNEVEAAVKENLNTVVWTADLSKSEVE